MGAQIMENEFSSFLFSLKLCCSCPRMVLSRIEVMGENNYPCEPQNKILDGECEFAFVGVAPGRVKKDLKDSSVNDAAFKYGSGKVLQRLIEYFDIKSFYITNLVKCNTPTDKIFLDDNVESCINKYFDYEVNLVKPRRIVVLGAQAREYFKKYSLHNKKTNVYFLTHPSAISRGFVKFDDYCLEFKKLMTGDEE